MKKIITIALAVLFCATVAYADEIDECLAGVANEEIRNTARQMIQTGIHSDDVIKMIRLMLSNEFSRQTVQRAQVMLMDAVREGLPAEPIMNKAYEGMAKKVRSETIVQAMEIVRTRYVFAYRQAAMLTKNLDQVRSLGNLMANTLSAGMEQDDVMTLSTRLQERIAQKDSDQAHKMTVETFRTARDMARLGTSPPAVVNVISQALRHHYSAQEMETLRNSFMNNAQQGAADTLAKSYAGEIGGGENAQDLGSPDPGGSGSGGSSSSGGGSGESGGSGSSGGSSSGNGDSGGTGDSNGGSGESSGSSGNSGESGGDSNGTGGSGGSNGESGEGSDGSGGSDDGSDGSGGTGGGNGGSGESGGGRQ